LSGEFVSTGLWTSFNMGNRCTAFSQSGTENYSNNVINDEILQVVRKCLYYQNKKREGTHMVTLVQIGMKYNMESQDLTLCRLL
jgi:hypothetical protein